MLSAASGEHVKKVSGRREGPSWWNGKLYFSDQGSGLYVIEPDGSCRHFALGGGVGTKPLPNGNLAACTFYLPSGASPFRSQIVELSPDGAIAGVLAETYEGAPLGMPNDLVPDRKGGLYFTDPWGGSKRIDNKLPGAAFYYRRSDGNIVRLCEWNELGFPNGCVLNPDDRRLFINDSHDSAIWVYDVNDDGTLSNKRVFTHLILHNRRKNNKEFKSGADGMALDRDGNLFYASRIGVQVFDKAGKLLGIIELPNEPSHCVFGGANLSTLYITALNQVYSIETKTRGYQYPIEE